MVLCRPQMGGWFLWAHVLGTVPRTFCYCPHFHDLRQRTAGSQGAYSLGRFVLQRWQLELFFKVLKHNLGVKTFVGTAANALKIQI